MVSALPVVIATEQTPNDQDALVVNATEQTQIAQAVPEDTFVLTPERPPEQRAVARAADERGNAERRAAYMKLGEQGGVLVGYAGVAHLVFNTSLITGLLTALTGTSGALLGLKVYNRIACRGNEPETRTLPE